MKVKIPILVIFIASAIYAQNQSLNTIGGTDQDWGQAIMLSGYPQEFFSVAGVTYSHGAGGSDFLLAKYCEQDGLLEWARAIGGADNELLYSGIFTSGFFYALTGLSWSYVPAEPPYGSGLLVVKLDFDGSFIWARVVRGLQNNVGYSIVQTRDDFGFVIAGNSESFPIDSNDYSNLFIVKFSPTGDFEWARTIGLSYYDVAHSIIQTTDGGFAVTGYVRCCGSGSPAFSNLILVKLNPSGDIEWTRIINGATGNEIGHCVIQTFDGGYAVAGLTWTFGVGSGDVFLLKFSSSGTLEWARTAGGTANDYGRTVIQTPDSGFVISGTTSSFGGGGSDLFFLKFSKNGNFVWAHTAGGAANEVGASMVRNRAGDFAMTGTTESHGSGSKDLIKLKFNFEGKTCIGDSVTPEIRYITPVVSTPTLYARTVYPTIWTVTPSSVNIPISHSTWCRSGEKELAILVNTSLEDRFCRALELAYRTCLERGFKKENIYVLNHVVTADLDGDAINDIRELATRTNLTYAIEKWAARRSDVLTSLYIFLTDHGNINYYPMLLGDDLTPTQLDAMLDNYKLYNDAYRVYFISDICMSGSFIDELSASGRVSMTSTNDTLSTWWVETGIAYFGHLIWGKFSLGYSFTQTFNWIAALVKSVLGDNMQIPMFDDNGDGIGHREPLPNGGDGDIGAGIRWGEGLPARALMETPVIELFTLEDVGDSILFTVQASVPIESCWVFAVRQDTTYSMIPGTMGVIHIPSVDLSPASPAEFRGGIHKSALHGEYRFVALTKSAPEGIFLVGDYSYPKTADSIVHVGVSADADKPDFLTIGVFPNPFNSAVAIATPIGSEVEIFDVLGKSVARLNSGTVTWKPEETVASGVYLIRAKGDKVEFTKRVLYLK